MCTRRGVVRDLGVDAHVVHPLPALGCGDVHPRGDGDVRGFRKHRRGHRNVARASFGQGQSPSHLARREGIAGGSAHECSIVAGYRGEFGLVWGIGGCS